MNICASWPISSSDLTSTSWLKSPWDMRWAVRVTSLIGTVMLLAITKPSPTVITSARTIAWTKISFDCDRKL